MQFVLLLGVEVLVDSIEGFLMAFAVWPLEVSDPVCVWEPPAPEAAWFGIKRGGGDGVSCIHRAIPVFQSIPPRCPCF